ncbi:MAG: DUF4091 domain-containing protein [bacterium]|nr:DUF4091 domain-containing protein [bacterium]
MTIFAATLLALLPSQEGAVRIWATGCTEKVQDDRRAELPHEGVWDETARVVRVRGVRGEHVPFQLVVTADHVEVEGVTVDVADLTRGEALLPAERIEVFLEYMVKVYAPTGTHGRVGYWPDALVPLSRPFDVRSARRDRGPVLKHQPLWVDIDVPRDQAPGLYRGEIVVSAGDEVLGSVGIELTIVDVELPARRTFAAQMGFFYGREIARVHGLDPESPEFRKLWFEYLGFLLDHRCDPTFIDLGVTGRVENGEYVVEWTDPALERFLVERGLARFALGAVPPGVSRAGAGEEQFRAWAEQYLAQVIAHARENGWYERLVFLAPVDEPQSAEEYAEARYWGALVRGVDPDVPLAVTEQPVPEDPSWGSLVGACSDWIVHGSFLDENREAIAQRQAAGETVTWYVSCDQVYPQANYYIDREAADPRMIGWITWRYRLGGILYWATTLWREVRDPFADAISWKHSHCNAPAAGEGMLLYPGNLIEKYTAQANVHGPIASLRLALLREGLEELELLRVLAESGRGELADELAASLCRDVHDFARDPVEIDAARDRLLSALAAQ